MQLSKLGIIGFFGILIPGAYIGGIILIIIINCASAFSWFEDMKYLKMTSANVLFYSAIYLSVSYLIGVLVRLFAPSIVDQLSTLYLSRIRNIQDAWVTDIFPYKITLASRLRMDGMNKIPCLLNRINSNYGANHNKSFFNYCKWFVEANNSELSRQVHQAEALVRFLAGSSIALIITIIVSVSMLILSIFMDMASFSLIYSAILVFSAMSIVLILERFKYQRRREVFMVWSCTYLILNGGCLDKIEFDSNEVIKSVFFEE